MVGMPVAKAPSIVVNLQREFPSWRDDHTIWLHRTFEWSLDAKRRRTKGRSAACALCCDSLCEILRGDAAL
eukprot:4095961-Amphidinium_carterae.1